MATYLFVLFQSTITLVERIVPGFAAERSGQIQAGDVVVAVDGVAVDAVPLDEIRQLTVGPEGTAVTVELLRRGDPLAVTLIRQVNKQ